MLGCSTDKTTIAILVSLVENGVNPHAIVRVMKEITREK